MPIPHPLGRIGVVDHPHILNPTPAEIETVDPYVHRRAVAGVGVAVEAFSDALAVHAPASDLGAAPSDHVETGPFIRLIDPDAGDRVADDHGACVFARWGTAEICCGEGNKRDAESDDVELLHGYKRVVSRIAERI